MHHEWYHTQSISYWSIISSMNIWRWRFSIEIPPIRCRTSLPFWLNFIGLEACWWDGKLLSCSTGSVERQDTFHKWELVRKQLCNNYITRSLSLRLSESHLHRWPCNGREQAVHSAKWHILTRSHRASEGTDACEKTFCCPRVVTKQRGGKRTKVNRHEAWNEHLLQSIRATKTSDSNVGRNATAFPE